MTPQSDPLIMTPFYRYIQHNTIETKPLYRYIKHNTIKMTPYDTMTPTKSVDFNEKALEFNRFQ